ncbi:hypothetical protein EV361DRAFT_935627, partial [Lentinula raphanica]
MRGRRIHKGEKGILGCGIGCITSGGAVRSFWAESLILHLLVGLSSLFHTHAMLTIFLEATWMLL